MDVIAVPAPTTTVGIKPPTELSRSSKASCSKPPIISSRARSLPVRSIPGATVDGGLVAIEGATAALTLSRPPLPLRVTSQSRGTSFGSQKSGMPPVGRPRLGTEITTGTASSFHRRSAHNDSFQFSVESLAMITSPGEIVLPEYVGVDFDPNDIQHSYPEDDDISLLLSNDDEASGYISPDEEDLRSPNTVMDSQEIDNWMHMWANNAPTKGSAVVPDPVIEKGSVNDQQPVYMPSSKEMDVKESGRLLISGWAAVSVSDYLRTQLALADGKPQLKRGDIAYIQLWNEDGEHMLKIYQEKYVKKIVLKPYMQVLSQEVCSRAGRCVILQDSYTREVLCVILPVSLPDCFFHEQGLVKAPFFSLLAPAMFTPFYNATLGSISSLEWGQEYCQRRYAPDEQHDAAMHILFCLDGALRQS
jgi:hypothetical protein